MMQLLYVQQGQKIDAPSPQFPYRSFEIKKQLGKGGEGQVFLAKPSGWNKDFDVAIKISDQMKETEHEFIQKLIETQNQNQKEQYGANSQIVSNIIRIYDIFKIQNYSIQVMEVGSTNLFKYMLENQNKLKNLEKFKICLQLLHAINFIHKEGLIHRDIKGENFILVNQEFKLIDFGLISINERMMTSKQGTRIFQAPELFEDQGQYTQSLDIWALGCVFYEIILGEELFPCTSLHTSIQLIKDHKRNQKPVYSLIDRLKVCSEWKELLKYMLHPSQDDRIKIEEAIKIVKKCIIQEENSSLQQTKVIQQSQNYDNENMSKIDFDSQLNQKQIEFNKALRDKDQLIKTLQSRMEKKENDEKQFLDDIEALKKKVNKLEEERKKLEQERNKFEQEKKEIYQQYQQYQQQIQSQFNYQVTQQTNLQIQQFNQQKQIYDNEIKNQKIRIFQLEQENQQFQKKLIQTKDDENTKLKLVNTNTEIIFLDKIIGDLNNEISNLKKSYESFKNIQQLLAFNNAQLNSQVSDIEQLIIVKQKSLQNYENIKLEIQDLDQRQQKQSDIFKTAVENKPQLDKALPSQVLNGLQQNNNQQPIIVPFQFRPGGNLQMQSYPPNNFCFTPQGSQININKTQ